MSERVVLVVVPDLFFATRIASTAKQLGVALREVDTGHALEVCRDATPDVAILDLHGPGDPLALARALKADPDTRAIPLVGFYSHVDQALRENALAAGIDHVLPRSAFTVKLPEILTGTRAS